MGRLLVLVKRVLVRKFSVYMCKYLVIYILTGRKGEKRRDLFIRVCGAYERK